MVAITFSISSPDPFGEVQAFSQTLDQSGNAYLVDHLRQLPRSGRAKQITSARISRDDFLGASERFGVAATHHCESAILGAGLTTGNWRIDEIEAALFCRCVKLACDFSGGGGVINEDFTLAHAGECAVCLSSGLKSNFDRGFVWPKLYI